MEGLDHNTSEGNVNEVDIVSEIAPKSDGLLGKQALSVASRFHTRVEQKKKFEENSDTPSLLIEQQKEMVRDSAMKYLDMLDNYPDVEEDIRMPLNELPPYAKRAQNNIFSSLISRSRTGSEFIKNAVNPSSKQISDESKFLALLLGDTPLSGTMYDFCSRLNEKDEQGNYVVPDRTASNFVAWYQASVAAYEAENMEELLGYQAYYYENMKLAIEQELLPESFAKNLDFLNPASKNYIDPSYKYIDMTDGIRGEEFVVYGGTCVRDHYGKRNALCEIQLNLESSLKNKGEEHNVVSHELTHAISGEMIEFDWNGEASRIFDEGMTESIKKRIEYAGFKAKMPREMENEEPKNFDGDTYENERLVLEFLRSGGKKEIDVMDFYAAYAEQDELREELRTATDRPFGQDEAIAKYGVEAERFFNAEKLPARRYGSAQQKLINELLEAFPNCHNLSDLGNMMIEKFNSL